MHRNLTEGKSTLVEVMAWERQATKIAWVIVDQELGHHLASLGHIEFSFRFRFCLKI